MERVLQQSDFAYTSLFRGVVLLIGLALTPEFGRADDKSATEPRPPLSLQEAGNIQGAATLVGMAFDGHAGFQQLPLLAHAYSMELFLEVGPRLAGTERSRAGAATLVLLGNTGQTAPLSEIILLRAGETLHCWELFDPNVVQPLKEELLSAVRDEKPLPTGKTVQDELESEAFYDAVLKANRIRSAVFDQTVRRDDGSKQPIITYAHVFREPKKYRGEVIRIEGKIRRIRVDPEPSITLRMAGVKQTYECWLFNDEYGPNNPVCIITTELPPGLRVNEKILKEYPVAFVGYFFKKYRYESGSTEKSKQLRDAPLLIGHIVPLRPIEPDDDGPDTLPAAMGTIGEWSKNLLIGFLGLVGLTVVVVAALSWWFHRGDAAVRSRVLARGTVLPEPDEPPGEATVPMAIPLPPRRGLEPPTPN